VIVQHLDRIKDGRHQLRLVDKDGSRAVLYTAFLELSQQFATLVEHVGTSGETPLFVAHCPMAFENKGASWIQGDKEVANPYYGAMMLRCGGIQEQLARE